MAQIGLFFGSLTGQTEAVAEMIREALADAHEVVVHNVAEATPEQFAQYAYLILAMPTWHVGQMQDDWDYFFPKFKQIDFTGKTVAFVGLGDCVGYADTFLDALRMLYDVVLANGGKVVGQWSTEGYTFEASKAIIDGKFIGLAIDQDNESDRTEQRVQAWAEQLKAELV
jgi:flavodoxin I